MSEYQYLEWQAVDRPLTSREIEEVNHLSSHMDVVTSTQAVVTYSWGDFKHDPEKVLLQYFDAFLYITNWGSYRLMFRFPKDSIDVEAIRPYCVGELISLVERNGYFVLDFSLDEEDGGEWISPEGDLGKLIPIRQQIIEGDYRALYLGWLGLSSDAGRGYSTGDDDEWDEGEGDEYGGEEGVEYEKEYSTIGSESDDVLIEPPVPAGLKKLNGSLQGFIDFFGIDPSIVEAAAQASPSMEAVPDDRLQAALSQLSRAECESFLSRILNNEPQVSSALRKRLAALAGVEIQPGGITRRSMAELRHAADRIGEEALRREKEEKERKRIAALKALAKREETAWREVDELFQEPKARTYDQGVALLVQLRDLAVYEHRYQDFQRRFVVLRDRYAKSASLTRRFRDAGLLSA